MEFPCDKCAIVKNPRYGKYYGACEGCPELEIWEVWFEGEEEKQRKNQRLQKAKIKVIQNNGG
ncbi:MAG: hypothetical protein WDA59_05075 [Methanofastidiosum sp.]